MATLGTQYQDVLSAIEGYYGSGSDQWAGFAKYGIAYKDAEATLSQIPGVDVFKNNAGQITGYAYNNPFSDSSAGIAGEINSNLQVPTQANGTTFSGSIPANSTINSGTGKLEISSGAKSTATGATVPSTLSYVSTAITGLSIGTRLGANIYETIYNSDPEYWDRTFPSINPQTWDTIASTKFGKNVINAIFGIDKSQNRTQMYIPENAFAYMAYGMAQEGFFATGDSTVPSYNPQSSAWNLRYPARLTFPLSFGGNVIMRHNITYDRTFTDTASGSGRIFSFIGVYNNVASWIFVSDAPFTVTDQDGVSRNSATYSIDNTLYYYFRGGTENLQYNEFSGAPLTAMNGYIENGDIVKCAFNGDMIEGGGKEGVEPQEGATYPTTTDWTSPEAARQNIRTQYPDLYNNSIYTDVAQQDGTTTRIYYYPVPATATNGANDTKPTNDTVTANDAGITPTSADDLIKTILRYLYQTDTRTKDDTPKPPDTPNPTDTGDGDTPTIVPPTGQASSLFAIYNPTQAELNSFGAWLWSSNFVDQILKLFNDPMQSIIGLHKIFAAPSISGASTIHVGYLDSGVSSNTVGAQYTTIDCGSVRVREQFGNVFDYSDTDVRLYLPFIGIVPLDVMDVMRGTVSVIYHVDVITGACLAEVRVSRDASGGTLYQYAGDAAVRYPISSGSYMGVVSGVLGVVGGIASGIMSGGATLPLMAGAAGAMAGARTQVQHSGSFAGNAGAMGAKKPYLILERPQTAVAKDYKPYQGMGANEIKTVSSMSGYFKMTDVHLNSIQGASDAELESIRVALEQGVIA